MSTTVREVLFSSEGEARSEINDALDKAGVLKAFVAFAGITGLDVVNLVVGLLNVPVEEVLSTAWEKHKDVQAAKASTEGNPGAREGVALLTHTVTSSQKARIEIVIGGAVRHTLPLELLLSVKVDAAVVDVWNGQVLGIKAGGATGTANLTAHGESLLKREIGSLDFPTI